MRRPERRLAFRLALALGMTVQELGVRLSYPEFQEWAVIYSREPWGDARLDLNIGHAIGAFANKRRPLRDFMLRWHWPEPGQEDMDVTHARRLLAKFQQFEDKHHARKHR
jgi:hypothetical protein